MTEPVIGNTDAPVAPCEECAQATQQQLAMAAAVGVAIGIGAFFVFTRYANR